ncbi:MAG: hypothetical protein OEY09_05585 [Gammaproteobacteria bacterium]|nr:hypothetical protein [Gammaproteobacteria bacterium]
MNFVYHELRKAGHCLPTVVVMSHTREAVDSLEVLRYVTAIRCRFKPERLFDLIREVMEGGPTKDGIET